MSTPADADQSAPGLAALQHALADLRLRYDLLDAEHHALREREAQLAALLDHAPIAIYTFSLWPERSLTYLNAGVEQLLGHPRAQLLCNLGLLAQIIHPDDLHAITRSIAAQAPAPFHHTLRCTHADGSALLIATLTIPLLGPQGQVLSFEGIAHDVTALKQSEADLRESRALLKQIIDNAPIPIRVRDAATNRYLLVNRCMAEVIGRPIEAIIGQTAGSLLAPQIAQETIQQDAQIAAGGQTIEYERRIMHRDGLLHTHLITKFAIPDGQGRISSVGAFHLDITDRKQMEEQIRHLNAQLEGRVRDRTLDLEMSNRMLRGEIADRELAEAALTEANQRLAALNAELRESRDLMRAIFDNLDDGLVLVGHAGTVLAANQALERLYPIEAAAIIGHPWEQYCSQTPPLITRTFSQGQPQIGRVRLSGPSDRQILVDMRTFPLADRTSTTRVLVHLTDITERVQLEALAMQNEQLAASSRLAAIVAHEVNTPLQAIQNFLFLASGSSGDQIAAFLGLIGEEIDRIGAMIRRLLDFHRPDDGLLKPISLNGLIERVLLLTGSTLVKKRISIERRLAPDLPLFIGRSDHMTQVLLNLIWNAIDSMQNGGTLRLHTFRHKRRNRPALIVLEVADTGPGIPPDLQARIFEPFFTTKLQGTGLGLAVSKQIITQHGGIIDVRSEPGVGSTFVITLQGVDSATAPSQP